jgi:hypothetical protein
MSRKERRRSHWSGMIIKQKQKPNGEKMAEEQIIPLEKYNLVHNKKIENESGLKPTIGTIKEENHEIQLESQLNKN